MKSPNIEKKSLIQIAEFMYNAAKTAPKAKGLDNIRGLIISAPKEKNRIIRWMQAMAKAEDKPGFARDSNNLKESPVILILGTKINPIGLTYCGFCGFSDCESCLKCKGICAYNPLDLGIAVGSAVSLAADFRVDNRIMYSVGKAAIALNLFADKNVKIALGIPLSAKGKNPFFDRK